MPGIDAASLHEARMLKALKAGSRKAASQEVAFFYWKEGPHGMPFMAIGKEADVKASVTDAGLNYRSQEASKSVKGTVSKGDNGLVFSTSNPTGAQFIRNLRKAPLSRIPAVKNASVRAIGTEPEGDSGGWTKVRAKLAWAPFRGRLVDSHQLAGDLQAILAQPDLSASDARTAESLLDEAIAELDLDIVDAKRALREARS